MLVQKLYLHIGRGKTGTSALQKILSKSRPALRRQGIQYVKAGDHGGGHLQFARSFIKNSPEHKSSENCRYRVIDEIRNSSSTTLMSSEHFEVADVADLREFFCRHLPNVAIKIVYFVRSQDELAESQYNQMVKVGRESCSFDDFVKHRLDGCNYAKVADLWAAHFGKSNIICRIYDARNPVDEQFLSCLSEVNISELQLPPERYIDRMIDYFRKIRRSKDVRDMLSLPTLSQNCSDGRENESLSYRVLNKVRVLNSLNAEQKKKLDTRLIYSVSGDDFPALFFDSNTAREFRDRFSASNRHFTRNYLGNETSDLGGRRYSDETRDAYRRQIEKLVIDDDRTSFMSLES